MDAALSCPAIPSIGRNPPVWPGIANTCSTRSERVIPEAGADRVAVVGGTDAHTRRRNAHLGARAEPDSATVRLGRTQCELKEIVNEVRAGRRQHRRPHMFLQRAFALIHSICHSRSRLGGGHGGAQGLDRDLQRIGLHVVLLQTQPRLDRHGSAGSQSQWCAAPVMVPSDARCGLASSRHHPTKLVAVNSTLILASTPVVFLATAAQALLSFHHERDHSVCFSRAGARAA